MCPEFHLSVVREAEKVVGERKRERVCHPLVTVWFVAQRSQADLHSYTTLFLLASNAPTVVRLSQIDRVVRAQLLAKTACSKLILTQPVAGRQICDNNT